MATARQRIPVHIDFSDGTPPADSLTWSVGRERLEVILPENAFLPEAGSALRFRFNTAGRAVEGTGTVAGNYHVTDQHGQQFVLAIAVTAFAPGAERTVLRTLFRDRLISLSTRDHHVRRAVVPHMPPSAPNTAPVGQARGGYWNDTAAKPPVEPTGAPGQPAEAAPADARPKHLRAGRHRADGIEEGWTSEGRHHLGEKVDPTKPKRLRANRYRWELEERFRLR